MPTDNWVSLREEYLHLRLNESIDFEKFTTISIVYHSTKIEGLSLNESDTRIFLENDLTSKGKPFSDHLMVKDHYNAFLAAMQKARNKERLTTELVKKICSMVMQNTGGKVNTMLGTFDTSKGDLRLSQVYVDHKYFPDFKKVPSLLDDLIKKVNEKLDGSLAPTEVIDLAADIHYNFVNIHPFGDGNGRTSRILMNYIQTYFQEPYIKIFTEDRAEYIDMLNMTEKDQNLEIFRSFIKNQQAKFFSEEIKKYKNKDSNFSFLF